MRTKLALLLALCRGAELLVLDEPTSGLDPATSEEVLHALVAGLVRVVRNHRVLSVVVSGGAERLIDEARSLQPVTIDSEPLTLKEVFLETVAREE